MVKLINGRGQLGVELKKILPPNDVDIKEEVYVYHTWNIEDKSKNRQRTEYEKFQLFVQSHRTAKIIFISTYSEKENWYNHYKQMAEGFLSLNCDRGFSLRVPTIIGKGILKKIKNNEVPVYGQMELITLHDAANTIKDFLDYDGIIKTFRIHGEKILALTAESLMKDV